MFQKGNKAAKGRKYKPSKSTVWVLEALKKENVDYTKVLATAIKQMALNALSVPGETADQESIRRGNYSRAVEMVNALARLAPHIANRPKETHGLEGIESLVINELPPKPKE